MSTGPWYCVVRDCLPHDAVILQLRDLRTLEGVLGEWVTDLVLLSTCLESLNKLVINALLDVDPGPGTATLAVVEEDSKVDPRDGVLDIGIREDDVGALSSELESHFLQV